MLILILGLSIIAFVVFICLQAKTKAYGRQQSYLYELYVILSWTFGLLIIGLIIAICILSTTVVTESSLDNKIAMYQEENAIIEEDINNIVYEYLKHEKDTLSSLKTEESSITLVTLFPELKSDTLVQQQLEIYIANNAEIKRLKENKIDIAKIRWILYFGM